MVIGNKFSEHLFQRLEIDLTNKQVIGIGDVDLKFIGFYELGI